MVIKSRRADEVAVKNNAQNISTCLYSVQTCSSAPTAERDALKDI